MERSVQLQEDDTGLKTLLELAENCPKFFRPQLERVLDYMIKVGTVVCCYGNITCCHGSFLVQKQWMIHGDI